MSSAPSYNYLLKILLIGDAGVGKSSLLLRFTDDTFDDHIQSTIGVDFKVKHTTIDDTPLKLTIWDTAGQERFRTLTSAYYRGAQAVLLVYDVGRRETFDNLKLWSEEVDRYSSCKEHIVKVLVGNKTDLGSSQVPEGMAEEWASSHNCIHLLSSARDSVGVTEAFSATVRKVLATPELLEKAAPGKGRVKLQPEGEGAEGGGACC
ncbi:hypothetical protein TrCOL_g7008 [Triparma columacea]|uniref:Uncharacterized protein n=1 Tax=Triparma columacea TaxID=722753 RepID=A0A9W7G7W8_9STRA|nr:hypothetical protein TrCOL_g7008 [Triparma columacea]